MKTRTLWLVAMLSVVALTLAGCNKAETPVEENNAEMPNPAAVYCEDNGGTLNLEDGTCTLTDGTVCDEWDFYNGACPVVEEETLPEGAKTSLTIEDLDAIDADNFPTGYDYSVFNVAENVLEDEGTYTYPEDLDHSLLLPIHATMASREIVSSGIEDGMIYTLTNVTLQDDTQLQILYINDPVTLQYVAASVENGDTTSNYQFVY